MRSVASQEWFREGAGAVAASKGKPRAGGGSEICSDQPTIGTVSEDSDDSDTDGGGGGSAAAAAAAVAPAPTAGYLTLDAAPLLTDSAPPDVTGRVVTAATSAAGGVQPAPTAAGGEEDAGLAAANGASSLLETAPLLAVSATAAAAAATRGDVTAAATGANRPASARWNGPTAATAKAAEGKAKGSAAVAADCVVWLRMSPRIHSVGVCIYTLGVLPSYIPPPPAAASPVGLPAGRRILVDKRIRRRPELRPARKRSFLSLPMFVPSLS